MPPSHSVMSAISLKGHLGAFSAARVRHSSYKGEQAGVGPFCMVCTLSPVMKATLEHAMLLVRAAKESR